MYRRKVKRGTGTGTKIGYPTLNFNIGSFENCYSEGVYKCEVIIKGKCYSGALYLGPTMHNKKVLEIFVIGLNKKIYGEYVTFKVFKKIRKPKKVADLAELKRMIKKDIG